MKTKSPKIKRKGITTKAVWELLADPQWSKDEEATSFLTDNVYRHADGHVMTIFSNGRGCLYPTPEDFAQLVEEIKLIKTMKPMHILKDRLLYNEDFIQHVPELVDQLASLLNIPKDQLDKSMDSLTTVQNKVKHLGRTKCIEAPIFAGLVAYIGEVMMAQIPNSQWQMRQSDQFPDTWEPWIIDSQGRICNPWSYLYDMLAEPSGGISIPHAAALAVQQRSVPHPHNASASVLMGRLSVQTKDST